MEIHHKWKQSLPWAMVISRTALGPAMILLSRYAQRGFPFVACILFALVLDVFDGILARRWNVATPLLRRCDTLADTIFYASAIVVVVLRYPVTLNRIWPILVVLVVLEFIQHLFSLLKFRRLASYHSRLSKVWGLLLATALIAVLGFGSDRLLAIAIAWGILCNLEGLAMSFVLPAWHHDVPTLSAAVWIRREIDDKARTRPKPDIVRI
jgi:CDP-diacylglycerol--glycerol-3-phosphate 3-phosphatidyltransferase